MVDQEASVYDRNDNVHRDMKLIALADETYAAAIMSPPGRNVDVLMGDQITDPFDIYMGIEEASGITLTADVTRADRVIIVAAGHGFVPGSYLVMSKPNRIYTGIVVSVSTNTIEMDSLVHDNFPVAETQILRGRHNLNVVGRPVDPPYAKIAVPQFGGAIDVTRIMVQMTCDSDPSWDTYGDIAKLIYGTQLRVVYDVGLSTQRCVPLWNIKDNSEYALHAFDVNFYLAGGPQGVSGFSIRSTFAGQSKRGVAIRLTAADELRLLLQDDLGSLLTHYYMAEGHVVLP